MDAKFQNGDMVKFESANPNRKGKFYTGTIEGSGTESVGMGIKEFGYWVRTGPQELKWVQPQDLQLVADKFTSQKPS